MTNNNEFLEVAKTAAIKAGEYLTENFDKKHIAEFKSGKDIGIAEDKESERIIINIINGKHPSHNFYSEEAGETNNDSNYTWYIDPLDGTNNYFAGIPYFSVSIALLKDDEIILGVVFNPVSNQLFEAVKNGGAFFNGKKIVPSENCELQKSVCSFIQGHSIATLEKLANEAEELKNKLSANCKRVINTWAPALDWCLLASGGIDAIISFESEFEDMYAGLLIAQEAGVKIFNFEGEKFQTGNKRILAANNILHQEIIELIRL